MGYPIAHLLAKSLARRDDDHHKGSPFGDYDGDDDDDDDNDYHGFGSLSRNHNSLSTGAIIGISIAAAVVFIALLSLCLCCCIRRRRRRQAGQTMDLSVKQDGELLGRRRTGSSASSSLVPFPGSAVQNQSGMTRFAKYANPSFSSAPSAESVPLQDVPSVPTAQSVHSQPTTQGEPNRQSLRDDPPAYEEAASMQPPQRASLVAPVDGFQRYRSLIIHDDPEAKAGLTSHAA